MDARTAAAAGPVPDGPARAAIRNRRARRADAALHEALAANLPTAPTEVAGK